jgi:hypothetical protein
MASLVLVLSIGALFCWINLNSQSLDSPDVARKSYLRRCSVLAVVVSRRTFRLYPPVVCFKLRRWTVMVFSRLFIP